MRRRILAILLALIFLCGCAGKESAESGGNTAVSLQTPDTGEEEKKEIPPATVTEYPLPEEVAALQKLELFDMDLHADEEQSMRNSNQLNVGYFASDEEGNIYYSDFASRSVFMCGPEGEGKELLYEGIGMYLYAADGYLYLEGVNPEENYDGDIVKINIHTKEIELLHENPCAEIRVIQDTLYTNISGFSMMRLDEEDKELVPLSEIGVVYFNSDGKYILYNMMTDNPKFLFERGYLLAWDTETETNYFVDSKKIFPLLAGDWFSFFDFRTSTRHVLNMRTGEDTDLGDYIQHAASDGHKLYWAEQETGRFQIMQWDGEEISALLTVEGEPDKYGDVFLYLTEDYLYWMYEMEMLERANWGYYRFADGYTGRLN